MKTLLKYSVCCFARQILPTFSLMILYMLSCVTLKYLFYCRYFKKKDNLLNIIYILLQQDSKAQLQKEKAHLHSHIQPC